MKSLQTAYSHIRATWCRKHQVMYAAWAAIMIALTVCHSWLIGVMAAAIWLVGIPVFVYEQRCPKVDKKIKEMARAASG